MEMAEITADVAVRVLETVDAGLTSGKGNPVPGQMCVEAAVCYAMGLPHSDDPICVSRALRSLKIALNDSNWSSNEARAKGLRRLALIQLGSRDILDDKEFVKRLTEMVIRKQVPVALRAAASIHPISLNKTALLIAADRCESEGTNQAAACAARAARAAGDAARDAVYAARAARAAGDAARAAARDAVYAAGAAGAAGDAAGAAGDAAGAAGDAARAAGDAARAADKVLSDFAEDVVQLLIEMDVPGAKWLYLAPKEV